MLLDFGLPCAAQHALQDALERQRLAALAREREVSTLQTGVTERQLALDAARRAEAGLRERLSIAERQLAHQSGEVQALREANEKLELAVEVLKVGGYMQRAACLFLMHGAAAALECCASDLAVCLVACARRRSWREQDKCRSSS